MDEATISASPTSSRGSRYAGRRRTRDAGATLEVAERGERGPRSDTNYSFWNDHFTMSDLSVLGDPTNGSTLLVRLDA
jgi:hypothetical protein